MPFITKNKSRLHFKDIKSFTTEFNKTSSMDPSILTLEQVTQVDSIYLGFI